MHAETEYRTGFLWLVCLVAAMGGLLFGYDWVVIGGAKPFYEPAFGITGDPYWQGFAMSTALMGCIVGALLSGGLSDKFGRKRLLILAAALFTSSAVWTALSSGFTTFNLARFLGGLGIGLASNLSPMYIAEISPAAKRGQFVSINQLTIVIGILAAQITNFMIAERTPTADQLRLLLNEESARAVAVDFPDLDIDKMKLDALEVVNPEALSAVRQAFPDVQFVHIEEETPTPDSAETKEGDEESPFDDLKAEKEELDVRMRSAYIRETWNGNYGWRWMFAAETVPAVAFFLMMFIVPESPRWLVKNGKPDHARRILALVGGADYAERETQSIAETISQEEVAHVRFGDLLEPRLLPILGLGVFLAVFQQWCGLNVVFNYAQEVFEAAGYAVDEVMMSIVITGVVNLVFTFVAMATVDRLGRRPLMLLGAGGLTVIYAVLGAGYFFEVKGVLMLALVVSAIACYAMTLAPITWVVISEIFPNRIRGAAMSVAVFSLWIGCTALTFSFPVLNKVLATSGVFWLYGAICLVGVVVIAMRLPETKGKSLEQIEHELTD